MAATGGSDDEMMEGDGPTAPEEPEAEPEETLPRPLGRAGQLGIAAVVVGALAVVAMTTPAPRDGREPSASPTGTVAGVLGTPRAASTPSPSDLGSDPSETQAPEPSTTPELADVLRGHYGSGIAADSKANLPVGPSGRVSHRFRASTTSDAVGTRLSLRGGPDGYSSGSGGTLRVSIQEDAGGVPSGVAIAQLFLEPGNPDDDWTQFDRHDFPAPAALREGAVYHLVYQNVDRAPRENFVSINDVYVDDPAMLSRPPGLGPEFATLHEDEGGWDVQSRYTPVVDLIYADGTHDGQAYIQALIDHPLFIAGPDHLARQTFVVSGDDRLVESVSVRVRRTYGDGQLAIRLETVDGEELETVTVQAGEIRVGEPGAFGAEVSEVWATRPFGAPQTLIAGRGYNLVLSTDDETEYTSIPLREGTEEGLESYRFLDGSAQHSLDGGTVWFEAFDQAPADLQFFFE